MTREIRLSSLSVNEVEVSNWVWAQKVEVKALKRAEIVSECGKVVKWPGGCRFKCQLESEHWKQLKWVNCVWTAEELEELENLFGCCFKGEDLRPEMVWSVTFECKYKRRWHVKKKRATLYQTKYPLMCKCKSAIRLLLIMKIVWGCVELKANLIIVQCLIITPCSCNILDSSF